MANDVAKQDDQANLDRLKRMFAAWNDNKVNETEEQRLHRKYYHGKQLSEEVLRALKRRKQPPIVANRIKRKIDFLVGMEQRQRRDPKAYPRTPQHEDSAEAVTDAVRFVLDNNEWPELASNAAHDGLVSGIGAVMIGVKRVRDRQEIEIKSIAADEFLYDPRSYQPDFKDARYMGVHKWLDIDDAETFLGAPVDFDTIKDALGGDELATLRDSDKEQTWYDLDKKRIRMIELYYKNRNVWHLAQFTGHNVVRDIPSPFFDEDGEPECPYKPWSPYIDEAGDHYGLVRDMKSPQDEINHRRSKLLHFMNVRQTHGEKGAVQDIDKMRLEAARPDGHIETAPNKQFDFVDNSFQANGQAELLQEAKAEIENLGPNPGLLGRGVEKQSGRAILAQQNSGMTELSPVFERLRMWKLRVYRTVWARIKQFWDGERWVRVTDSEGGSEFIGLNTPALDEFGQASLDEFSQLNMQHKVAELDLDIILDEGPDTLVVQEEEFERISNMVRAGVPIPPDIIIELSQLRNKDKILERMRGNPEAQAQEDAQKKELLVADAQSQLEERQSKTELNQAKANSEKLDMTLKASEVAASSVPVF